MFRRLRNAWDNLIAALERWTAAINKHADDLEAEPSAKSPTETNGVHTGAGHKRERAGSR